MRLKSFVFTTIVVLVSSLAGISFWYIHSSSAQTEDPVPSPNPSEVSNEPVKVTVLTLDQSTTEKNTIVNIRGKIVSDGTVRLTASVPATIKEILFTQGKSVKKGDVLMRLGGDEESKHGLELAYEQAKINQANLERSFKNAQAATSLAVRQAEQQANALEVNLGQLQKTLELTQNAGRFTIEGAEIGLENLENSLERTQSLRNRNLTQLDLTGNQAQQIAAIQAQNTARSMLTTLQGGYIPLVSGIYDLTQDTTFRDFKRDLENIVDSLEDFRSVSDLRINEKLADLSDTLYELLDKNEDIATEISEINNPQAKVLADALRQITGTITTAVTMTISQLAGTQNQLEALPGSVSIQKQTLDSQVAGIQDQIRSLQTTTDQVRNASELQAQAIRGQIEGLKQQRISAGLGIETAKVAAKSQTDSLAGQLDIVEKQLEQAQNALTQLEIVSPIDGYIVDVPVNDGELVTIGKELATVYATNVLFVRANISPLDRASLNIGDMADLAINTDTISGKAGASIVRIAPVADANGLIPVDLAFTASELPISFVPGVTVQGQIKKEILSLSSDATIKVPLDAVQLNNGESSVFIYENGLAKKVPVQLGPTSGDKVTILSGLNRGDKVIVSSLTLEDAMPVMPANE